MYITIEVNLKDGEKRVMFLFHTNRSMSYINIEKITTKRQDKIYDEINEID